MLRWTEEYATGDPVIDSQHQTLIGYINRLEGICSNTNFDREEVEFILNLVDFVEIYTISHFKHEEGCMVRHRCPAHEQNKTAHARFLEFFQEFKQRFKVEGGRPDVLNQLHKASSEWIQQHILLIDTQLRPCLSQTPDEGATSG